MSRDVDRHHDADPDLPGLDEARRMVETDVERGSMYPHASGPLMWTRAAAIAQVEQATALVRIADALELIAGKLGSS